MVEISFINSLLISLMMVGLVAGSGCDKAHTDAITLVNEGVRSLNRGDLDTANGYFRRAARLDPTNAAAHYHQGLVALAQKLPASDAAKHFARAEKLERESSHSRGQVTESARAHSYYSVRRYRYSSFNSLAGQFWLSKFGWTNLAVPVYLRML